MPVKKYEKYIRREPLEIGKIPGINLANLTLLGQKEFNMASYHMGMFCVPKPMVMVPEAHAHDFDQIVCFIGGNPENMKEFGAEVEFSFGEEGEKHIINTTTVVYMPKGLIHGPLIFTKVEKPILFIDMFFADSYAQKKIKK
jgi:hypothetical protein